MHTVKDAVFGLGNNIDYEVLWDSDAFHTLAAAYQITAGELNRDLKKPVEDERDLVVSILSFMRRGIGGECFVQSPGTIFQYASRFRTVHTLGGTGVRAAIAAAKRGIPATLHLVNMNADVRRLLPKECLFLCSAKEERCTPPDHPVSGEQRISFHDIDFVIPQSNRVIYVNDPDNTALALSEGLGNALAEAKLFLVSGFNAMHNQALLLRRLGELAEAMERMPAEGTVFFEDGCYHDPAFSRIVNRALAPHVHIFSMNEDELAYYAGRTVRLLDPADVADALKVVHGEIPVPLLVLHTRYWALAHGEGAKQVGRALRGGVAMATARFLMGDGYGQEEYQHVLTLPAEQEGRQFAAQIHALLGKGVWCEPSVDAATATPTTIGLGDAFVGGFLAEYLSGLVKT